MRVLRVLCILHAGGTLLSCAYRRPADVHCKLAAALFSAEMRRCSPAVLQSLGQRVVCAINKSVVIKTRPLRHRLNCHPQFTCPLYFPIGSPTFLLFSISPFLISLFLHFSDSCSFSRAVTHRQFHFVALAAAHKIPSYKLLCFQEFAKRAKKKKKENNSSA